MTEVDLFLCRNSLVTVHYDDHRIFDYLYNRAEKDERLLSRGADFALHAVVDAIVDNYNATLDILEYEVDQVEENVLGDPAYARRSRTKRVSVSASPAMRFTKAVMSATAVPPATSAEKPPRSTS